VPIDPNALALYQQDVLKELRALLAQIEDMEASYEHVRRRAAVLELVRDAGHELATLAYDDDGELLNPDAEEMVDAIHNGVVPDLEDASGQIVESLEALEGDLRESIASVEVIQVPPHAMVRVMTAERLEEEAERTPPRSRSRR
jgi:hypothetical protein